MFKLNVKTHGVQAGVVKNHDNVTKAALASLRLALKAYFNTYYICSEKRLISSMSVPPSDPLYDISMGAIDNLCENIEYQEQFMQTIFHFHHFFELFLKDILSTVHKNLAQKIMLDGKDSSEILKVLLNIGDVNITQDNTAEFAVALERVCTLSKRTEGFVPIVVKTITDYQKTLKDLNLLRNKVWHKGIYILRITELDQFISQNILPLVVKVLKITHYRGLEKYWKYKEAEYDPINEIISAGRPGIIDYKRIAFFKSYGFACYKIPKWNFDLLDINAKAKAIVGAVHDLELETCYVCKEETLLVSTVSDHDIDREGNFLGAWWNSTAAECLNCSLSVFPDAGEPMDYGVKNEILWKSGDYDYES
ncbi:hypothetical protein [Paenibacillus terrae]|uniref:Uncharacterized protein n=1 Tax=Paenibacillus terrae TaxID=159743 RepID=A0A0D7WUF6_9BACL|nr:hypothetical protein [Paenibacillus terrae]KJD42790.1 hypothetical protein QD47_26215 [Paenibacillus terrae]